MVRFIILWSDWIITFASYTSTPQRYPGAKAPGVVVLHSISGLLSLNTSSSTPGNKKEVWNMFSPSRCSLIEISSLTQSWLFYGLTWMMLMINFLILMKKFIHWWIQWLFFSFFERINIWKWLVILWLLFQFLSFDLSFIQISILSCADPLNVFDRRRASWREIHHI